MPTDKVTTTLFAKQELFKSNPNSVRTMLREQYANVVKMQKALTEAAIAAKRTPPEFEVSLTLVPDWSVDDNGYENESYLEDKNAYLDMAREIFGEDMVQDFYTQGGLTADEKGYLHQLQALGSIADMMKNRAIINNQDRRHLQIDSNTKIQNYPDFYNKTLGRKSQQDGLNASYYDPNYVSVHNKVVYTMPNGKLGAALKDNYLQYCREHKNDKGDKAPEKNSMYARVFAASMADAGYARKAATLKPSGDVRVFYPANMQLSEFLMTGNVVTAINMSWAPPGDVLAQLKGLKSIPSIAVRKVAIDFPAFTYAVKKHTHDLDLHTIGLVDAPDPRKQLLILSDNHFDKELVTSYFNFVKANYPEHLVALVESIPPTPLGNAFVKQNFNRSRDELLLQAKKIHLDKQIEDLQREKPSKSGRLENVINHEMALLSKKGLELDSKRPQIQFKDREARVAELAKLSYSEINRKKLEIDDKLTAIGTQAPKRDQQIQMKKFLSELHDAEKLKKASLELGTSNESHLELSE